MNLIQKIRQARMSEVTFNTILEKFWFCKFYIIFQTSVTSSLFFGGNNLNPDEKFSNSHIPGLSLFHTESEKSFTEIA